MTYQTASQRILKWLRANGIPLGALTSHDTAALRAATEIAELWSRGGGEGQRNSAIAFGKVVQQMQETTQFMAYHAVAMVADWSHRDELWIEAELPKHVLERKPECAFWPRRNTAAA